MMKIKSLILMLLCATCAFAAKVDKNVNITVDGVSRSYILYVPNNVKENAPLIVVLHGANGHSTDRQLRFTQVADQEGCIVLFPQGRVIAFPIGFGGSTTGWEASGEVNTDVNFIRAIVAQTEEDYSVDKNRIYCCGFSNGGMMSYALTNTCSDLFAAFASISGYPLNEFHFRHTGERPVPFLHIHGKSDNFVLYSLMPVIVDEMVARVGANPVPVKTTVTGKYDKSVYEATEGSFPYTYYEIDGMGHSDWTGNTPEGHSAMTMYNFFMQYTLDTPCNKTLKWMPRVDQEDYKPKSHGWTVNTGNYLYWFGKEQDTGVNGNHNVYRSLQLDNGNYKLCFKSTGEAGKRIPVQIKKLTGSKEDVLVDTVNVGEEVSLPIRITDGWGEYAIRIKRESTTDVINISNLAIYTATDEEMEAFATKISEVEESTRHQPFTAIYTTSGVAVKELQKGINIVKMSNGETKKLVKN